MLSFCLSEVQIGGNLRSDFSLPSAFTSVRQFQQRSPDKVRLDWHVTQS